MAGTGSREHNWNHFEEYARQRESVGVGMIGSSRNPLSPTAGRLHKEDMAIYGREPATDRMLLVVCNLCGRVIKLQAVIKHNEIYHCGNSKKWSLSRLPVQTVGQSTSGHRTLSENSRGGEPGSLKQHQDNMVDGGTREKTSGGKKVSKEYDPDRHCGVWLDQEKKHCRKSITCKIHNLAQRIKVVGRSKPFRSLLAEHKKSKKLKKLEKQRQSNSTMPPPPAPPPSQPSPIPPVYNHTAVMSPAQSSKDLSLSPRPMSVLSDQSDFSSSARLWDKHEDDGEGSAKMFASDDSSESLLLGSHVEQSYPRPAAVCSFGSRRFSRGLTCFSRRSDSLRSAVASLSKMDKDSNGLADPGLIKKHRHIFKQRQQLQRKYTFYGKQDHVLLNQKPDFVTAPAVVPTSLPPPTTTFSASQFYNGLIPQPPAPLLGDSTVITNSIDQPSNPAPGGKRKRSRRGSTVKNAVKEENGVPQAVGSDPSGMPGSWSGGQTVLPGGQTVLSGGQTVLSGGQTVLSGGQMVLPGGQTVLPGGQTVLPGGPQTVFSGGQTVVPGGQTVLPGGQTVLPGGQTVLSGGPLSMSGGLVTGQNDATGYVKIEQNHTQDINRVKPPGLNGLVPSAASAHNLTSQQQQQHPYNSTQRFLINPSSVDQQSLPAGIMPLGSVGMTAPSPAASHYPTLPLQLISAATAPDPHLLQQLMAAQNQQTLSSSASAQGLQWLPTGSFQDNTMLSLPAHHQTIPASFNNISAFSGANQLQGFGRPLMQSSLGGPKATPVNNSLNLLTRPLHPPAASTSAPALQQVDGKADFLSQSSLLLAQNVAQHTQQVL